MSLLDRVWARAQLAERAEESAQAQLAEADASVMVLYEYSLPQRQNLLYVRARGHVFDHRLHRQSRTSQQRSPVLSG
jgi:hypothetical protein